LGLKPSRETSDGIAYEQNGKTVLYIYETAGAGTAQHTIVIFIVADIQAEVAKLRARGIAFEDYDYPNLKTVDGIAQLGSEYAAWLKDSESNFIAVVQNF
jgi:hypothetical protein